MSNLALRLIPLLVFACQGASEVDEQDVSISPRLSTEPSSSPSSSSPSSNAAEPGPAGASQTSPSKAYGGATLATGAKGDSLAFFSDALVPESAHSDPEQGTFTKRGSRYELRAGRGKQAFTWAISPVDGSKLLDVITIEDDDARVRPLAGANAIGIGAPRIQNMRRVGKTLEVTYDEGLTMTFTAYGRSLMVELERLGGTRRGRLEFGLGGVIAEEDASINRILRVPYFDTSTVAALEVDGEPRFLSAWLDPAFSNSSQIMADDPDRRAPGGGRYYSQHARYLNATNRLRRPVRERLWITWGSELAEALPSMNRAPSPDRANVGKSFYLSYTNTPFEKAADELELLSGMGLEDVQVWMHHWQKDGYDKGYPDDVMPPRLEWGGLAGLRKVRDTAAAAGFGFSLHHNWLFNSNRVPGNSLLSSIGEAVATAEGGQYLKHAPALAMVDDVEGEMHEKIGTRGTFSDSISAGYPLVDLDKDIEDWGLQRGPLDAYREILERLRTIHGAPVAGEGSLGGGNVLWSGVVDVMPGSLFVASQPSMVGRNGRFADVIPHFALGRLHDISVRAGMGPPRRFVAPERWTMASGFLPSERDLVMSLTALYGNAGYHWWYQLTRPGTAARDWWSGREVQTALSAPGRAPTEVRYLDEAGRERSFEEHLIAGGDFSAGAVRMRLEWEGGGQLWVNLTPKPWTPKGRKEAIAANGHLFVEGAIYAGILEREGSTIEVSHGLRRRYVDGRGLRVEEGGLATDGAVGMLPLDLGTDEGWHLFPIAEYTLSMTPPSREKLVQLSYIELSAPLVTPGEWELVYLDAAGLECHGETRTVAADGLVIEGEDLAWYGAVSVRVRPM